MQTRILFIHHSVGRYILQTGRLRDRLVEASNEKCEVLLDDTDYARIGFHDNSGALIDPPPILMPDDDTDPPAYFGLFSERNADLPIVRRILEYDIIAFKSCYPASNIRTDSGLADQMEGYRQVAKFFESFPDKVFVPLTHPPLAPLRTTSRAAQRAQVLAGWMTDSVTGMSSQSNICVFDLHSRLADVSQGHTSGMLRRDFRRLAPWDSHPNKLGCEFAASEFARHISGILAAGHA